MSAWAAAGDSVKCLSLSEYEVMPRSSRHQQIKSLSGHHQVYYLALTALLFKTIFGVKQGFFFGVIPSPPYYACRPTRVR